MVAKDVLLTEIVDNPFQSRTIYDPEAIRSLAEDIKAEGFWSPLQGRRNGDGKIELVFGHRRIRALRLLKIPSVLVDILPLTDEQMALRSLEENLQREGLTDFEKADAVHRLVEIEKQQRKKSGKPERGAIQIVVDRLGFARSWVSELCEISERLASKEDRSIVKEGEIAEQTASQAKQWGGETYLKTVARQGKQASKGGTLKPTHETVRAMKKAVADAPEPIREKLKKEIFSGKLTLPSKVEERARRLMTERIRRTKEPPPDLRAVIIGWTRELMAWSEKMAQVAPYMDYVEEVPDIAEPFYAALRQLIATARA